MKTFPKSATIDVDPLCFQKAINGIHSLVSATITDVYDFTLEGILTINKKDSRENNALDFLERHYERTSSALFLIDAMLDILDDALTNDDLRIVPGEWQTQKAEYAERVKKYTVEREKLLQESENLSAEDLAAKLTELAKKYNM